MEPSALLRDFEEVLKFFFGERPSDVSTICVGVELRDLG